MWLKVCPNGRPKEGSIIIYILNTVVTVKVRPSINCFVQEKDPSVVLFILNGVSETAAKD